MNLYLNALGIVNPLGCGKDEIAKNLFAGSQDGLVPDDTYIAGSSVYVGSVDADLPLIPDDFSVHKSRNNQLALLALQEIETDIQNIITDYGRDRIAVVVGTSTSGIGENEPAIAEKILNGAFPDDYYYQQQAISDLSQFIQEYLGISGPAMTVSTACTSGAKSVAAAARWIEAGICDAAIVGGADSLCGLTLNGFHALDSLSKGVCRPFGRDRDGINIGEGAAFFILSRKLGAVEFCGYGETSDAYHISSPAPDGVGAMRAMDLARGDNAVAYINLHGTATQLNDAMEARAVHSLFGDNVPCSSTKSLTGHMLGASGANELGFLWLSLIHGRLPPHIFDGGVDADLEPLNYVQLGDRLTPSDKLLLSNSFAFGGSNICLAVRRGDL